MKGELVRDVALGWPSTDKSVSFPGRGQESERERDGIEGFRVALFRRQNRRVAYLAPSLAVARAELVDELVA